MISLYDALQDSIELDKRIDDKQTANVYGFLFDLMAFRREFYGELYGYFEYLEKKMDNGDPNPYHQYRVNMLKRIIEAFRNV